MRHKGIWIEVVLIVILLAGFWFNTYYFFHNNDLNQALVGQAEEDRYPDWEKWDSSTKVSRLQCDIISKKGLKYMMQFLQCKYPYFCYYPQAGFYFEQTAIGF